MEQPAKRRKLSRDEQWIHYPDRHVAEKNENSETYDSFLVREYGEREIRRSRQQQRFYRRQDVAVQTAIQTATVEILGHIDEDGDTIPVMTIQPTPPPSDPTDLLELAESLSADERIEIAQADDPTEESLDAPATEPDVATSPPLSPLPDEASDEPSDSPSDESSDEPSDLLAGAPFEVISDESIDEPTDEASEEPLGESTDEVLNEVPDEAPDEVSDEELEDTLQEVPEELSDAPADETPDESADVLLGPVLDSDNEDEDEDEAAESSSEAVEEEPSSEATGASDDDNPISEDSGDNGSDNEASDDDVSDEGSDDDGGSDGDVSEEGSDDENSEGDVFEEGSDAEGLLEDLSDVEDLDVPAVVIDPDNLPTDASLFTTLVTFEGESTTWTSLVTIDLESVDTLDALVIAGAEPTGDSDAFASSSPSTRLSPSITSAGVNTFATGTLGGIGNLDLATETAGASADEDDSDGGSGGSDGTLDTPEVVGGVVGGIAGVAVVLLIVLLLLRWYRSRRLTPQELTGSDNGEPPSSFSNTRNLGQRPFAVPAAGMFKRFSPMSWSSRSIPSPPPPMAQRSFERISGRKLPSAFSPALTAADTPPTTGLAGASRVDTESHPRPGVVTRRSIVPPGVPPTAGPTAAAAAARTSPPLNNHDEDDVDDAATNTSSSSFYRYSRVEPLVTTGHGISSPPRTGVSFGSRAGAGLDETETIRPSPARTPIIHAANSPFQSPPQQQQQQHSPFADTLSPPVTPLGPPATGAGMTGMSQSPNQTSPRPSGPGPRPGTLGRSLPSFDGSRSSRFTEDV